MKPVRIAKKLRLTEADLSAIQTAVKEAEAATSGEIALAVTRESSDYSFFELAAAVVLGALVFAALLPLHGRLDALLAHFLWQVPAWQITALSGALAFGSMALFFLLANIPALDRLIIPAPIRRHMVYTRALRHFVESGTYATADRTGILIFISLMEREVRVIADTGIAVKIEQGEWDAIASGIARGVHDGRFCESLIAAVATCGSLLTTHFPAGKSNPNELTDGLVILEGSL